jgi:hypothetical protein
MRWQDAAQADELAESQTCGQEIRFLTQAWAMSSGCRQPRGNIAQNAALRLHLPAT